MREPAAARDWLTVFQLPAYASELNPFESVWSHLARSLANIAERDIAQLTALVKTRLRRMQYHRGSRIRSSRREIGIALASFIALTQRDSVSCTARKQ